MFFFLIWLTCFDHNDLGEIGTGTRSCSPLIDVEAVSDDESDIPNSTTVGQWLSGLCLLIFVVSGCCFSLLLSNLTLLISTVISLLTGSKLIWFHIFHYTKFIWIRWLGTCLKYNLKWFVQYSPDPNHMTEIL